MRSVAHVLTAYLAHEVKEKRHIITSTVDGVVLRGDDATEIMAFYLAEFGKPIPNALKKGIGDALKKFDAYTLAKYKAGKKSVKMRDLLCLCRPKPIDKEQSDLWKRVLDGTLEPPVTWEVELSKNGNTAETWEKLIDSEKVGYMALLRNLRSIIAANPRNIEKVYQKIEDPEVVKRSKQLPFRFLSAYKAIQDIAGSRALGALERGASASVENLPKLPGTTVIAIDVSGSMLWRGISARSTVQVADVALLLGFMANRICNNAIVYAFSDKIQKLSIPDDVSLLDAVVRARGDVVGRSTDMQLPFLEMIKKKIKADRVIILSDNECNCGQKTILHLVRKYEKEIACNIWVHAVDLCGYGTQQFCGKRTNIIAGWSEKVLEFICVAERGEGNLIERIEKYCW